MQTVFSRMHRRALSSTRCRRGTHYDTLGVKRDASLAQIKTAFFALSKEHHPDVPDHKEKPQFHQISEAYNVLRDPVSRRAYDNTLPVAQGPAPSTLHSRHMADTAARLRRTAAAPAQPSGAPATARWRATGFGRGTDPPFPRRPPAPRHAPLPGAHERHHRHPGQRYTPPDPAAQAAAWAARKEALREQKTRGQRYMAGIVLGCGMLFAAGWITAEMGTKLATIAPKEQQAVRVQPIEKCKLEEYFGPHSAGLS
ncbi:hypothetical protein GGX14DRAFT_542144 [Mycena pura]|uniref:J domain-containing protein n=1 Tax=Mycena pura TaxID=153505 RepID=A0AAD6VKV4_9AGAR|nr:hypothetical protein GGX14DRAFT_542144 [Mycena pura]